MISSATGNDENLIDIAHFLRSPVQLGEGDELAISVQATGHSVAHSLGLFIDFLQHEMLKAALFSSLGVPINLENLLADGSAIDILHPHALSGHSRDFAVAHDEGATGVVNNSRNIGGNEVFALAQANNQRIILLSTNNLVRLILAHEHQGIGALDELQNLLDGLFKIAIILILQQMCHNLTIGLGQEDMTFGDQFLLQGQIIFDNAIVHNHEFAAAIHMRMRIAIGRTAMSRPTGVANAHGANGHIACQF